MARRCSFFNRNSRFSEGRGVGKENPSVKGCFERDASLGRNPGTLENFAWPGRVGNEGKEEIGAFRLRPLVC